MKIINLVIKYVKKTKLLYNKNYKEIKNGFNTN